MNDELGLIPKEMCFGRAQNSCLLWPQPCSHGNSYLERTSSCIIPKGVAPNDILGYDQGMFRIGDDVSYPCALLAENRFIGKA